MSRNNPLVKRIFKYKKAKTRFYCPLCRTERALTISPRIKRSHWLQIALTSVVITIFTFSYLKFVSFASFFLVWGVFELVIRALFKRQLPCPHCGFDASWYKRDVKVARRKVSEFWEGKTNSKAEEMPVETPTAP